MALNKTAYKLAINKNHLKPKYLQLLAFLHINNKERQKN